jgi:hypothetical protein
VNLIYCMQTAEECGESRHPQTVMRELGITYEKSTPQSLYDSWWFWNCTGAPDPLPKYLNELGARPHECIGDGLSKEDADRLAPEGQLTDE